MRNPFAVTVLILIGISGLVPFLLILSGSDSSDSDFFTAYDAIMLQPWSTVVYAILFGIGALMYFQITNPVFSLLLLPALLAAVWPIFSFKPTLLPAPIGAVVAFYKEHETATTSSKGCPIGWTRYDGLAGRFPLGAGQGTSADGKPLTKRMLGDEALGSENVALGPLEIPAHSHAYQDIYYSVDSGIGKGPSTVEVPGEIGSGDHDKNNVGHQISRQTSNNSGGGPHNNMPPYQVVVFCEFIGMKAGARQEPKSD